MTVSSEIPRGSPWPGSCSGLGSWADWKAIGGFKVVNVLADRFSSAGQGAARPFHPALCILLSGQLLSARPGVARFLTPDAGLVIACSKTTCKAGPRRASLSNTLISKMETEMGPKYLA